MGSGENILQQPAVLIIADDPEFPRAVMARWQTERTVPAFTLIGSQVWNGASLTAFDLAIVGVVSGGLLHASLKPLDATGKPVVCVCNDAKTLQALREKLPRILALRQDEGWLESLMLVTGEALRRGEAVKRARQAEESAALDQRFATLGRYMLDMRHNLNNALTSVLGNSELLLLEPGALSAQVSDQIDTIRNMALRMHEIIQRFSSLDTELKASAENADTQASNGKKAFVASAR